MPVLENCSTKLKCGKGPPPERVSLRSQSPSCPAPQNGLAAGLGVVVIAGILFFRSRINPHPSAPHPPVTLLIADFDNKTGDSVFDGTLEPMLGIALEGAPFISSFNRGQAKKDAARLQPGAARMDASLAQLVASARRCQRGCHWFDHAGRKRLQSLREHAGSRHGQADLTEQRSASNKQDVLAAAGKLAESIRKGLGDTTPESAQQVRCRNLQRRLA